MQYYKIALKLLEVKQNTYSYYVGTQQMTTNTYTLVTESREHEVFEILSVPKDNIIGNGFSNNTDYIGFWADANDIMGVYIEDCFVADFEFEHKENIFWDNFTVLRNIGRKLPDKTLGVK